MLSIPFRNLLTGLSLVLLAVGCGHSGPPLGTVTGTVTMNGEPVAGAIVVFVPEEKGAPSYGATDENGVYHLMFNRTRAGAEIGTHHVLIEAREPETEDDGTLIDSTPISKIPAKYRQHGVLSADVSWGRNELDFTLDAEGPAGQKLVAN